MVDLDLEKFFDRVNHDMLMARIAARVSDKRVLKLIRAFLNAGVMEDGLVHPTDEGNPGGPLSPLLSNIVLDDLDERTWPGGDTICRYADDCNIYVRSRRAGERVMNSVTRFLTERLKLKVNEAKSAVALPGERKFLGFTIANNGAKRRIASKALSKFKVKIRDMTSRTRGRSLEQNCRRPRPVSHWLARVLWFLPDTAGAHEPGSMDTPETRSYLWRQWRNGHNRFKELAPPWRLEVPRGGRGRLTHKWRMSSHPAVQQALRNHVFDDLGLPRLYVAEACRPGRTAMVRTRMPGGVGEGGAVERPYPDQRPNSEMPGQVIIRGSENE